MSFIVEFSKLASAEDVYAVYELAELEKNAAVRVKITRNGKTNEFAASSVSKMLSQMRKTPSSVATAPVEASEGVGLGAKAMDMLRRHKGEAAAGALGSAGAYGVHRLINKNKKTE